MPVVVQVARALAAEGQVQVDRRYFIRPQRDVDLLPFARYAGHIEHALRRFGRGARQGLLNSAEQVRVPGAAQRAGQAQPR